jgi:hypothetical protein
MNKLVAGFIGLWLLAGAAAMAQTKTDFSGSWYLNKEKSVFGPLPPPELMTQTIEHKDPDLKVTTYTLDGQHPAVSYEAKYTTDGKECLNKFGGQINLKSKLVWDHATLIVDTEMENGGTHLMTLKGKWTLSADGKVLTQAEHIESPQGAIDVSYVFDKQ